VDQALVKALQFFAGLAIFDHNVKQGDRMRIETAMQDKTEVKVLANAKTFPPGFQPALALKEGYLVLASSPEAIRRFGTGTGGVSPDSEVLLLRLSCIELGSFLKSRRESIVEFLAASNKTSKDATAKALANVVACLELFERLEVTQRTDAGQLLLTLRLRTNQPTR
jgi:hypothetical protein